MRRTGLVSLAVGALVAGVWFGEDPSVFTSVFGLLPSLACIGVGVLVVFLALSLSASVRGALESGLSVTLCLAALATGVLAGGRESRAAYAGCFAGREALRATLEDYRKHHDRYPGSLAELEPPVPGALALHRSLFRYRRTPEGYEIIFRGPIFIHVSTEAYPFTSGK